MADQTIAITTPQREASSTFAQIAVLAMLAATGTLATNILLPSLPQICPTAIAALTSLVPFSQITYGTDYPYFPLNQIESLKRLNLGADNLAAIASGNASKLLPRLNA